MKATSADHELFTLDQIAVDIEEELRRLQGGEEPKDTRALSFARRTVNELFEELADLPEEEQRAFTTVLGVCTGQLAFYLKYLVLTRKTIRNSRYRETTA